MGIRLVKVPDLRKLAQEAREKRKQILEREMLYAKTEITSRTTQGLDVNDQTFEPYSPEYAKFRRDKGYQVTPPNLTITGNMLKSIFLKTEEKPSSIASILLFAGALEAVKARSVNKLREFFALSPQRLEKILRALNGRSG